MTDSPAHNQSEALLIPERTIYGYMNTTFRWDIEWPNGTEFVRLAVKSFLDPDNAYWTDEIHEDGFFEMWKDWIQYVWTSQKLRILTLVLCSRSAANFIYTNWGVLAKIKDEIKTILRNLTEAERSIFMDFIWPSIKFKIHDERSWSHPLHSFEVVVIEDLMNEVGKVEELVWNIFNVGKTTRLANMTSAREFTSKPYIKAETAIFVVDGSIPESIWAQWTVSTTSLIASIKGLVGNVVVISNTADAVIRSEHEGAGLTQFWNKDKDKLSNIFREILWEKLTS